MMKRSRLSLLLLFFLLLAGCGEGTPDEEVILGEIRSVQHFELTEMELTESFIIRGSGTTIEGIRSLSEAADYVDNLLRPGDRIGVYSFTHTAIAYLDLSRLSTDKVRVEGKKVWLTLPPVEVKLAGRSPTLEVLHERVTGTKRPITSEERKKLQDEASQRTTARLRPGSATYDLLCRRGERQATAYFSGLLHARGYEMVHIAFDRHE